MAQSAPPFPAATLDAPAVARPGIARSREERGEAPAREAARETSGVDLAELQLSSVALEHEVVVVRLTLEDDMTAWLRAVGIGEGDRVRVLRRAAFGGPLHVRTGSGGEFALHRTLARAIVVRASTQRVPSADEGSAA